MQCDHSGILDRRMRCCEEAKHPCIAHLQRFEGGDDAVLDTRFGGRPDSQEADLTVRKLLAADAFTTAGRKVALPAAHAGRGA